MKWFHWSAVIGSGVLATFAAYQAIAAQGLTTAAQFAQHTKEYDVAEWTWRLLLGALVGWFGVMLRQQQDQNKLFVQAMIEAQRETAHVLNNHLSKIEQGLAVLLDRSERKEDKS